MTLAAYLHDSTTYTTRRPCRSSHRLAGCWSSSTKVAARVIAGFRARTGHRHEIKFSKSNNEMRDKFFAAVAGCPFSIRALVVDKERIRGTRLQTDHDEFYRFFISQLARRAAGALTEVNMSIDGSGGAQFQRALRRQLSHDLQGKISGFRLADSRRDDFIQLADMCVGAVARAFRPHNRSDRWLRMIEPRVDDIWEFK